MQKLQFKDIINFINPFQNCYRIGIVKEFSFKILRYNELPQYLEYYVKSITADKEEENKICLSFVLAKNYND